MTLSNLLSRNLLLTTMACAALAACGGERTYSGSYNGDGVENRTAAGPAGAPQGTVPARLTRLEQEVATLKTDFSQLAMTYNGLMTTNERIDSLLTKLEAERAAAPVAVVEKAPVAKAAPKPASKPTASLPKETTVVGVRLGEHETKTRLVIDASKLNAVATDLDNGEKILLITLGKTAWQAKEIVSGLSSPLVAGWSVQDTGGIKTLAVQLKKPVKILSTEKLGAAKGNPARFVVDLAAS